MIYLIYCARVFLFSKLFILNVRLIEFVLLLIKFSFIMTLERKLKRREGLRLVFHNNLKSAEEYLSNEDVEEAKLKAFKTMLSKSIEQLSDVDDEVVALLDPDAVPDDIVESMQMQGKATFVESEIDVRLSQIVKANESTSSLPLSTPSVSSISNVSRLPKIELPVFKGDPLKWQGFWDQFQTSIHNNERISDIDRFNFLKRYLGGETLDSVDGLNLNSENYKEAIELLIDRYGNEQVLISAHMQSLLKIQKVRSKDNVKGLRTLYNHVESCVRNLKALKLEVRGYGSLLIPLLKEKLPDDLMIVISRKFGSAIWTLDFLLKHLNEELRVLRRTVQLLLEEEPYVQMRMSVSLLVISCPRQNLRVFVCFAMTIDIILPNAERFQTCVHVETF